MLTKTSCNKTASTSLEFSTAIAKVYSKRRKIQISILILRGLERDKNSKSVLKAYTHKEQENE